MSEAPPINRSFGYLSRLIRRKEGILEIDGNPGFDIQKIAMKDSGPSLIVKVIMEGQPVQEYVLDETGIRAGVYGEHSPVEHTKSEAEQLTELVEMISKIRRKGVK